MAMDNAGVIDTFLNTFTTYIDSGFGLVQGDVLSLSSTLIVIDITLAGLFWAWGADEDIIQRLVKKTLYIGFFAYIIGNFDELAKILFNSFAGLGLTAGGSSIPLKQFLQPGQLAEVGFKAGQPLMDAAEKLVGPVGLFTNAIQIAVLMVSWLLVLIAFFVLAVQLFVTLIEFKLTTLAGFVLVPFALFGKTAFPAEKVLGNIVASGIKVMVLAVVVGIGTGLFAQFTTNYGNAEPTTSQALSTVLAALALLGLGIFGPGIATGLVSGAPQLGAGAAVGTGIAVAGAAMTGAGAVGLAGRGAMAAASGSAAAARGGAALAGGATAAYRAGGASGVVMASASKGGNAVMSPMRRAASSLKSSFQSGAQAVSGGAAPSAAASNTSPPAWAQRVKHGQNLKRGAQAAAQAVKSGDSTGGGHSVNLSEGE